MFQQLALKFILLAGLTVGAATHAHAQTTFPHEVLLTDAALALADAMETAGYPQASSDIRRNCTDPKKWLQCVEVAAIHAGTFLIFREHAVVGTVYTTLGENEAARDYANCERDPSLTGTPTEFGSYHCAEHLVNDPFWIALRTSMHALADGAETAGYPAEANSIRRACQYQGDVNFEFLACSLSTVELLTAIFAANRGDDTAAPSCSTGGLVPVCTALRPTTLFVLSDLGLDQADQTGDAVFAVDDLALIAGSGSVLDSLLGTLPDEGSARWAQLMLGAVAAGPSMTAGTPVADDQLTYLRAIGAANADHTVLTVRRASRLTP